VSKDIIIYQGYNNIFFKDNNIYKLGAKQARRLSGVGRPQTWRRETGASFQNIWHESGNCKKLITNF
jgi:hypothetical protein